MIIVSQDRNEIVNFNNMNNILIVDFNIKNNCFQRIQANTDRDYYVLGDYATEERAKEVLQEIIKSIENWENLKAGQPSGICKFVYEMPKE
jgi:hypothetical protein